MGLCARLLLGRVVIGWLSYNFAVMVTTRHVKPQFVVKTSVFGRGKETISSFTGVIRQISLLPVHRTMLAVLDQSLCTKLFTKLVHFYQET